MYALSIVFIIIKILSSGGLKLTLSLELRAFSSVSFSTRSQSLNISSRYFGEGESVMRAKFEAVLQAAFLDNSKCFLVDQEIVLPLVTIY